MWLRAAEGAEVSDCGSAICKPPGAQSSSSEDMQRESPLLRLHLSRIRGSQAYELLTQRRVYLEASRRLQHPVSSTWEERWTVKQSRRRKVVIGAGPDTAVSANRMIIRRPGEGSVPAEGCQTALEQRAGREGSLDCRLRSWSESSPTGSARCFRGSYSLPSLPSLKSTMLEW